MPKVVLPCPFKVGDILKKTDDPQILAKGFNIGIGGGSFIVDSISTYPTGDAFGEPCLGIYIRPLGADKLSEPDKHHQHFWPGFFELDPFLNAVKNRRKRRNKP